MRLMKEFAIKGIETLKNERETIDDEHSFDVVCASYYNYAVKYCLNK